MSEKHAVSEGQPSASIELTAAEHKAKEIVIVIVGAGPVGLWTAIQIKKRRPSIIVKIYERYSEYQRSHVLKLESRSMLLYAKNARNTAEETFFNSVWGTGLKKAFLKAVTGSSVFIRTNALEKALKTYAADLGITTDYQRIESPESLMAMHPDCENFIAADGAHSLLRQAIMGGDALKDYPLQYVAEIKYETSGATKALSSYQQYKSNKLLSSMAFEYVGRERDGKTPVSLRFFVDEDIYDAMPEASFKQPLNLANTDIPASLKQDIEHYMRIRANQAGEDFIQGSEKLSKLTLSLYRAKEFATQKHQRNWYLAGDAAMGVPYFRSLNAGMIIGSQLACILTRDSWSNKNKIAAYNTCRPLDVAWEFTTASVKNIALKSYDTFRKLSAKAPWEFMKWDDVEQEEFMKTPAKTPPKNQP